VFRLHGTALLILCTTCNYSGLGVDGESAQRLMSTLNKEFILYQETCFRSWGPPPNGEGLNPSQFWIFLRRNAQHFVITHTGRKSRKNITFPT